MARYRVTQGGVAHDGEVVRMGGFIELTEQEAARLARFVTLAPEEPEPPEPPEPLAAPTKKKGAMSNEN
jgi:hypothetical protein